ncbi:hypothetical protein LCGC14_1710060 [marine sediment metagenome]|uniref:Uncharacterized protein n=1 Tax=marine sediment metagenome TaxID=412755 RepID=A0A0F9HG39_9ZZZZ
MGKYDKYAKKAQRKKNDYETTKEILRISCSLQMDELAKIIHYKLCEVYTRTGNPKGIEGPLAQLQGFGWKFVEKNKNILFGGWE